MIGVSVQVDIDRISRELKLASQDLEDKATIRALNRTIVTVRKEAVKNIRAVYNIQAAPLRSRLRKRDAQRGRPVATLKAVDRPIPLTAFGARWRRGQKVGATVQIAKGGGRIAIAGGFVATTRARGVRGVFRRTGKDRFPLVFLTSNELPEAAMPKLFLNSQVAAANESVARQRFKVAYTQEAKFVLSKVSRG